MKKFTNYFVFTGPESSGKTTLANWFAVNYKLPLVPEYARMYIDQINRPYRKNEVMIMARGQLSIECQYHHESKIVCDTDLLTYMIWFEVKYGSIPDWIVKWFMHSDHRYYFLCAPDVPWEYDPQRENPDDRAFLFERYIHYLESFSKDYLILSGGLSKRQEILVNNFTT